MEGVRPTRLELGEAAGHLKAELYEIQDRYRRGQITESTLHARVQAIRACAENVRKPAKGTTLPLLLLVD
jgi:hypothetical protein